MWINNYPEMIAESPEKLLEQEKRLRGSPLENRVKMLRLLKTRQYRSRRSLLPTCSATAAVSWSALVAGLPTGRSLDALLEIQKPSGRSERITREALDVLEEQMKQGNISTLGEAREFLEERFSIHYEGVSGLSRLFKRYQTKLKTGRRRHQKASLEEQAAFKK